MKKPGFLLFLAGILVVMVGVLIYLAFSNPKISTKAKLVRQQQWILSEEGGRKQV